MPALSPVFDFIVAASKNDCLPIYPQSCRKALFPAGVSFACPTTGKPITAYFNSAVIGSRVYRIYDPAFPADTKIHRSKLMPQGKIKVVHLVEIV
jgi:hypothetical protein